MPYVAEALTVFEDLAAGGEEVALVLAGTAALGMTGSELLDEAPSPSSTAEREL